MLTCTLALKYAMCSVGVRHKLKLLAVFDQLIDQSFGVLKMHVVVASTMYQQ